MLEKTSPFVVMFPPMRMYTISSTPLAAIFLVLALSTTAAASAPPAAAPHPLVRALEASDEQAKALPASELRVLADWLMGWSMLGAKAPVTGSTDRYFEAISKARRFYAEAHKKNPTDPKVLWKHAFALYTYGELLPKDAKKKRMALYEEMIALTDKCLNFAPKEPGCHHFKAVGTGRLGTTKGVLSSMMVASELEEHWKKAIDFEPSDVHVWGDPLLPGVYYALAVFYRIVPDLWLVKLAIGTRGDKEKSVDLLRKATQLIPYRLELQKELAVALTCYGHDKDEPDALQEGRTLFKRIIAGDFDKKDVRATDAIDKRHSQDMLSKPELACSYSRDGYQEIDPDKAREQFEKEKAAAK